MCFPYSPAFYEISSLRDRQHVLPSCLRHGILALLIVAGGVCLPPVPALGQSTQSSRSAQKPRPDAAWVRGERSTFPNIGLTEGSTPLLASDLRLHHFELEVVFRPETAYEFGLLTHRQATQHLRIGYSFTSGTVFIAGDMWDGADTVQVNLLTDEPVALENNLLRLHILARDTLLTVTAQDEKATLSTTISQALLQQGLDLYAHGGNTNIVSFTLWPLELRANGQH